MSLNFVVTVIRGCARIVLFVYKHKFVCNRLMRPCMKTRWFIAYKVVLIHKYYYTSTTLDKTCYYRPQRSCGKVMFSQVSVILSTGGWGVWEPPPGQTPHLPGQTPQPPRQTPHWEDTPWADTPGQTPPWADTAPPGRPPADGYCSGRYASYWNAFLFHYEVFLIHNHGVIVYKKVLIWYICATRIFLFKRGNRIRSGTDVFPTHRRNTGFLWK